jgi:protein-S-isoprenylcysteine O-methyltransferase Ste14
MFDIRINVFLNILGMIFLLGSISIIFFGQKHLGAYWHPGIAIRMRQAIVDKGIYKKIRHPIYTGSFLGAIGISLLTQNIIIIILNLCFIIALYTRTIREENLLSEEFGGKYFDYKKRTRMFF